MPKAALMFFVSVAVALAVILKRHRMVPLAAVVGIPLL
jgi:hypothetical protein